MKIGGWLLGALVRQQISWKEILLGDQIQNMLAVVATGSLISRRGSVLSFERRVLGTGKEVVGRASPDAPPVGL